MTWRATILFLSILSVDYAFGQPTRFSITTDFGLQRSFKKEQQFFAFGQTIQGHIHFTPTVGAYIWVAYYSDGKFSNDITATAKSTSTNPSKINYTNNAVMRFKHISIGWKKYLKGTFDAEQKWNLYCYAGFGIILGRVDNSHSVSIDTTIYKVPVLSGMANFKRLTLDVGLGWEQPVGADIFFYTEGRVWIPTTDYPSKYIFVNNNAPLVGMLNFGVRILF